MNLLDTGQINTVMEYCTLDKYVEFRQAFLPSRLEIFGMPHCNMNQKTGMPEKVARETFIVNGEKVEQYYVKIGFPYGCEKPAIINRGDVKKLCQQLFQFLRRKFTFK